MNGVSGFVFDSNSFDLSQAITPGRNNSAYAEKKSGLGGLGALGAIAALAAAVYTGGAALGAWGAAEGAAGAGLVAAETAEAATLGASLATEAGGSFLGNGITGSMFANSAAAVPGFTAETLGAGLSTMQATGLGAAQYVGLGAASASAIPTVAEVLNYARQGVSTAQTASRLFSSPSPSSGIAGLSSGLSLSGVPGKAGYSSGFSDFMGIGMPQATRAGNGIFPQDTGAAASGLDLSTLALGFVAIAGVLYFAKGL
jgi:filamentous hemagglutinin